MPGTGAHACTLAPNSHNMRRPSPRLLTARPAPTPAAAPQMVGLIGSVTGTAMGFFFPGMLALRDPGGGWRLRALGWCVLVGAGVWGGRGARVQGHC